MCNSSINVAKKLQLYKKLIASIKKVKKKNKVSKNIKNILYAKQFLLPCIYLLNSVNYRTLCKLAFKAIKQNNVLSKIIVKSVVSRLINKQKILQITNSYQVTALKASYVKSVFNKKTLNQLQLKIINFKNRKKSTFNYNKIPYAHP